MYPLKSPTALQKHLAENSTKRKKRKNKRKGREKVEKRKLEHQLGELRNRTCWCITLTKREVYKKATHKKK